AAGIARLKDLASATLIQVNVDEKQDRITELFDKYNLLTLPVVDEDGKLAGVITADDIISVLRQRRRMGGIVAGVGYHLAVFFAVIGPGFITAVVDNDSGGIIT